MNSKNWGRPPPIPMLGPTNYMYWKRRMEAYITAQGADIWFSVLDGGKHPTTTMYPQSGSSDPPKVVMKDRSDWSNEEKAQFTANARARNYIYSGVGEDQFCMICFCTTAKEAWEALEAFYEGSADVREMRLQRVQTVYDGLRMSNDETIFEYYFRFIDVVNQACALGSVMDTQKQVYKMLRTVSEKFEPEVVVLELQKKTKTMSLESLVGILQAFEINHLSDDEEQSKSKSNEKLPFKTNRFLSNKLEGIKCFECGGVGHIKSECASASQRREGKLLQVTWSDVDN